MLVCSYWQHKARELFFIKSESQISHLDLSHCQIEKIDPLAFCGLEKSLESIDLSANRLRRLPRAMFEDSDLVRKLKLNDNMLSISPNLSFNGFRLVS